MKILTFTTLFPNKELPNYAVFVKERIVNIAALCDIRVVAPVPWHKSSRMPKEEIIEGVKVYHPRYFMTPKIFRSLYGFFMFFSLFMYVKHLKKEFDFDLIDGHFVYPDGLAAVLLGRVMGVKVCLTARGTDINWYPRFNLIRKLIRYTLNRADCLISVNSDLKEKMIALDAPEDKIHVIPNGIDFRKFYLISRAMARGETRLPLNRKLVLSIGNLIEAKGFDVLIKAISKVRRADVDLFIIGEGPYRKKLELLIKKLSLGERIKLLGALPQAELYKWYSSCDLFCLMSLREGRPNVVLEAMACGVPVVSMNRWGLSEIIKKETGMLLDSYEPEAAARAIEDVLSLNWNREKIALSVQHLDWKKTANALIGLFNSLVNKKDILFFSSDDWDSGLKTSKYHLSVRLAKDNRVFFINSLTLRVPTASKRDAKRVFNKLLKFFKGVIRIRENLFVYTPIVIPFYGSRVARFMNNLLISLQIKMIIRKFDVKAPLVWTFLPNSLGVIRRLNKKGLIYYCVDDMSAFKGVPADIIRGLDNEMTREANIVFAVSQELFKEKRAINENTFYSPHGVDFELFNKAVTEKDIIQPADIQDIRHPIIGFYGLISSDWIDYDLIRFLAQKRPAWSFVFVGKIDAVKEEPPKANNIYYLPVKPYEELYKYSRFFDIAMLPFNINQLTMHSHPLKILEYLSAGKPVVSIAIPEVMKYADVIEIAARYEEFLDKIERSLKFNDRNAVESRIRFASSSSWEKRFDEIQDTVCNHI